MTNTTPIIFISKEIINFLKHLLKLLFSLKYLPKKNIYILLE